MFDLTIEKLAELLNGQPSAECMADTAISGAIIDSRDAKHGNAFFAFPGQNGHGLNFADQAIQNGAACVITDRNSAAGLSAGVPHIAAVPSIEVKDTLEALQNLAFWNRSQSEALIVAVTGSVGKTTTRQMLASVLSAGYCGTQSPRNFNNHIGVPLSLIQLEPKHEFAVLEIGASAQGEIRKLADIARPELAVITRVSPAHLESFGCLQTIQKTKQELVESLPSHGTAFLNGDDSLVRAMRGVSRAAVVLFGESSDCDVRAYDVRCDGGKLSFQVDRQCYQVSASGRHFLCSALASVAVGMHVGLSADQIQQGLSGFTADIGRGRITRLPNATIIDDSYNASPASVEAAATCLSDWTACRHRILVLGDMLELGAKAGDLHKAAGRAISQLRIDHILLLGQHAEDVAAGILEQDCPVSASMQRLQNRVSVFRDRQLLLEMLDCVISPGDVVLVKGSRGLQMERIVQHLQTPREIPATRRSAA